MKKFYILILSVLIVYTLTTAFAVHHKTNLFSGDARYYYAWLHTLVVDRDLDFTNEYTELGISERYAWDAQHHPAYIAPIGSALLWLPFYAISYKIFGGTGYEPVYQISVSLGTIFYIILGNVLLYRVLIKYYSDDIACLTVLSICLATNIYYYSSLSPLYSHGLTFFLAALILFLFEYRYAVINVGAVFGLLYLTRIQDMVYIIFLLPYLKGDYNKYIKFFSIFSVFILVQSLIWNAIYNHFLVNPYFLPSIDLSFHSFNPYNILFSSDNGLFFRTPIILLSVIGFIFKNSKIKYAKYFFIVLITQLVIASYFWDRGGWQYSQRFFIPVLPILAFGLAGFLNKLVTYKINKIVIIIILGCLIAFNVAGSLKFSGLL